MRKLFFIIGVLAIIAGLSIMGCKLLNRLDGRGQYVCQDHGHTVDEAEASAGITSHSDTYGCSRWTYQEEIDNEEK